MGTRGKGHGHGNGSRDQATVHGPRVQGPYAGLSNCGSQTVRVLALGHGPWGMGGMGQHGAREQGHCNGLWAQALVNGPRGQGPWAWVTAKDAAEFKQLFRMGYGLWAMGYGPWAMGHGPWGMAWGMGMGRHGAWASA